MNIPPFDELAPITWMIAQINTVVSTGASAVADAISGGIAPIVSACFGIYVLLMMIQFMRGAHTDHAGEFMLKMAAWALIIGFGLNASNYDSVVAPMVTGLGNDLGNLASGGTVTAGTLDQLALAYLKIIDAGYEATGDGLMGVAASFLVSVKALIVIVGLVPFLVGATLSIIVANVGSQLIAMVGPLYFAFLLFPATRQYFSSWLNTAFSYALIPLFVAVISMISVGISQAMMPPGTDLNGAKFSTVFLAAIGNVLLLFLLKTVAALASSLSAGGINAQMAPGLGAMAGGVRSFMRGSARDVKSVQNAGKAIHAAAQRVDARRANSNNSIRKGA